MLTIKDRDMLTGMSAKSHLSSPRPVSEYCKYYICLISKEVLAKQNQKPKIG